jgi:hypothetical protein
MNLDFSPEYKEFGVNYPSKLKPYCNTIVKALEKREAI